MLENSSYGGIATVPKQLVSVQDKVSWAIFRKPLYQNVKFTSMTPLYSNTSLVLGYTLKLCYPTPRLSEKPLLPFCCLE